MTKPIIPWLRELVENRNGVSFEWDELPLLVAEIDEAVRAAHEPTGDLPLGFVMVAQCASCEQKDLPGAAHSYKCAAYPGQYVRVQKR